MKDSAKLDMVNIRGDFILHLHCLRAWHKHLNKYSRRYTCPCHHADDICCCNCDIEACLTAWMCVCAERTYNQVYFRHC